MRSLHEMRDAVEAGVIRRFDVPVARLALRILRIRLVVTILAYLALAMRIGISKMSVRARMWLAVNSAMTGALAFICIFEADSFKSSSYDVAKHIMPLHFWGFGFLLVAIYCVVGGFRGHESRARTGIMLSVVMTIMWATTFIIGSIDGTAAGWTGHIIWLSMASKDFLQLSTPLQLPFEETARRIASEEDEHELEGAKA